MGIIRQHLRLSNIAMPQIEEVDALALVDSGSLELCIPQSLADRLKLTRLQDREVILASGEVRKVPYVGGVKVEMFGRETTVAANVMGDEVLLGAIPMEAMDLLIHPASLQLIPNPAHPNIPASLAKGVRPGRTDHA
jgi:clan AA aspartic protease